MKAHPYTTLVLIVGLALRAALVPLGYGDDFRVWDLASRYTLAGVNIYRDHPPYPGGPYTYFPLFLYLELPLQWLAQHGGAPFAVLGKLPIVAGDLLTGALLARILARRGCPDAVVALGAALYFLNPLVLYNGAFYGRFDTLCVGLLLLALLVHDTDTSRPRHWAFPLLYALAVATKTYPVFLLPWLLTREPWGHRRLLLALVAVLGGLSLPYLLTSPARFVADVLLYNANKLPSHLSWQVLLLDALPPLAARIIGYVLLVLFVAALYCYRHLDLWTYATVALLLFILLNKVVIEQYLLWPLPFLIVDTVRYRSWASGGLLVLLSGAGMLVNPYVYPFGASPAPVAVVLAVAILLYIRARTQRQSNKSFGCVSFTLGRGPHPPTPSP